MTIKDFDAKKVILEDRYKSDEYETMTLYFKANGQSHYIDADGNEKLSAINKLKEEGDWDKMSKNLSSQFLSKQPIQLIKKQLDLTYADAADEFSEICSLNNPTVKRKLLLDFADECDSAAVHLKAAALPRQSTQVILPLNAMKETEIFAPNYADLWKVKHAMAREQAVGELEGLREETQQNIAKLREEADQELTEYRALWQEKMNQVTEDANAQLEQLRRSFEEKVGLIKNNTEDELQEMADTAQKVLTEAGWDETGKQIVKGLTEGVQSEKSSFVDEITQLALAGVQAAKSTLDIHSPSRVFREIGNYTGLGFVKGLQDYVDRSYAAGSEMAESAEGGLSGVLQTIVTNAGARISGSGADLVVSSGITMSEEPSYGSDLRIKNSIDYDLASYEAFFLALKPSTFKYNKGTSGRKHFGFIAQDVEQAMLDTGLTSDQLAALVKDPVKEILSDGITDYRYSIRYGELIALNTHMIQKLYQMVEELLQQKEG